MRHIEIERVKYYFKNQIRLWYMELKVRVISNSTRIIYLKLTKNKTLFQNKMTKGDLGRAIPLELPPFWLEFFQFTCQKPYIKIFH